MYATFKGQPISIKEIELFKPCVNHGAHIAIYNYPTDWQTKREFANWRNDRLALCGFFEVTSITPHYLISSVY